MSWEKKFAGVANELGSHCMNFDARQHSWCFSLCIGSSDIIIYGSGPVYDLPVARSFTRAGNRLDFKSNLLKFIHV